jgi:hypothetical protein
MDTNTKTIKCRHTAYIPFKLMEMVLGAKLTARNAYELNVPVLLDTWYESVCEPLMD